MTAGVGDETRAVIIKSCECKKYMAAYFKITRIIEDVFWMIHNKVICKSRPLNSQNNHTLLLKCFFSFALFRGRLNIANDGSGVLWKSCVLATV